MESANQFLKVFRVQTRRWLFVVLVVAVTHLLFQSLLLPYGKALRSLMPDSEVGVHDESGLPALKSFSKSVMVRNPLTVNASDLMSDSVFKGSLEDDEDSKFGSDTGDDSGLREVDGDTNNGIVSEGKGQDNPIELVTDREVDDDSVAENVKDLNDLSELEIERIGENSATVEPAGEAKQSLPLKQIVQPNLEIVSDGVPEQHTSQSIANIGGEKTLSIVSPLTNITHLKTEESNASSAARSAVPKSDIATSVNISALIGSPGKKKMRCNMPPKTVTSIFEMNDILMRHHRSSRAMRPRWSSVRDKEVLAAKTEIEKASVSVSDQELHAPLFRNVSMFKRSYELMDRTLKVYVYRDGKKPIFHQPILKGLYASEGWFMKLMEGNKHFAVKDPRKAHLFYMPFSSRMLEYALYVRNSHNRTNLRQYLKEYAESIAAKYRYWNRTGGADHFLVACHDWAPYETRHHMEHCIKALCNADVTAGFKLGRDVSLPETYVRSARNPLRDLGGKPPSQRHILAFYADLWSNASWSCKQNELHPTHEEQQILYLPQGL
ncbi:probable glycosyltransferase At5g03795 [Citrus sinensis]|uniref:probable glycosyltransferase At5g03795 n=1 Tax=Citrus clementina TaxID=85681 RepID=UPI000CED256B|nr:probable glycosyltransferase At5g03795 [Citrus x clementina]XP_024949693.1 probable glycosyltransferase At5g03795 [Citrus sinensis]